MDLKKIINHHSSNFSKIDNKFLNDLHNDGYCLIENDRILKWLNKDLDFIKELIDKLIKEEGEKAGFEGREEHFKIGKKFEPNSNRLGNLPNKHEIFRKFVMFPDILECAFSVIQEEIMFSSSNFREPLKNSGDQRLHIDWLPRKNKNQNFQSVIAMFYLDDSTFENGAIKVIPKTHKIIGWPDEYLDPYKENSEIITIPAKAGSLLIINGNLWHKGGNNFNGKRRRIINATYRSRHLKQGLNQKIYLDKNIKKIMTEKEKYIFKIRDADSIQKEKIFGPGKFYREWINTRKIN